LELTKVSYYSNTLTEETRMRISKLVFSTLLAAAATPAFAEEKPIDWRSLAIGDVEAAYQITREQHPGMFDKSNPGFPALLDKARTEALLLAGKTSTAAGFEASLGRFKAVVNDGHAGAYANLPEPHQPKIKWPGFVAAWRGQAMYVYKSALSDLPAGAQILSCDAVDVPSLVRRNVFGFHNGIKVPGEYWSLARRLFVDDGNPFVRLPKNCQFQIKGKRVARTLSWTETPDYYQSWRDGSANGERLPIGMVERAPRLFWFALPDFQPDEAGTAAYKKMYADVITSRPQLLAAHAIVLDLRFNNGGSSNWSKMLAENLWGKARVERALKTYFAKTQTWWRPTAGNLDAVKEFIPLLEQQADAASVTLIKQFVPVFEAAVLRGDKFLIEPDLPETANKGDEAEPLPLTTPVYVIVPGQCASACLDAIDYFKQFPQTRLIGAPSSSDSTYMEVRTQALPSKMAEVIIPMKMYVDRPRGNGVFYTPDILVTDFDWSTANFLKRIQADLNSKPAAKL
jgi:hypothetical protein